MHACVYACMCICNVCMYVLIVVWLCLCCMYVGFNYIYIAMFSGRCWDSTGWHRFTLCKLKGHIFVWCMKEHFIHFIIISLQIIEINNWYIPCRSLAVVLYDLAQNPHIFCTLHRFRCHDRAKRNGIAPATQSGEGWDRPGTTEQRGMGSTRHRRAERDGIAPTPQIGEGWSRPDSA